jgi:PAS domain S-box-containing protein
MESHCLKCHAGRGARVGALSILLPVGEKIAAHRRTMWALGPLYLLIYLLGTGFLGLGRRLLLKRAAARALAVEALEESERNFRTVADFAYAWEYWLAPDGSMKYVSPAAEKMTGYPPGRFMADPDLLRNIVLGSDPELLHHHLQGDMRRGEHEIDFQIRTAGGELRWLRHSCRPIYGSRGEFLGRRASNHDITEELAAKKALEQTVGELKSALDKVKLLSGFLPICASCKKIRDDRGYWNQIESYITEHSNAVFSHGICPDCKKRLYPEFCDEEDR